MKNKTILLFLILLSCILICSCTSTQKQDTYFIHAVGFDFDGSNYTVHAVCEKQGEKKSDYFVVSQNDKSIGTATKKLTDKYKECYFATVQLYFLSENFDKEQIMSLAKEICESNIYPSKSSIAITDAELKVFLGKIKNDDELRKISNYSKKSNTVMFFSKYLNKSPVSLPLFSLDKKGKPSYKEHVKIQK